MIRCIHRFSKLTNFVVLILALYSTVGSLQAANNVHVVSEWVYNESQSHDLQTIHFYYSNHLFSFETTTNLDYQFDVFLNHKNLLIKNTLKTTENIDFPDYSSVIIKYSQVSKHCSEPRA